MNTLLIGDGYWGNIIKPKLKLLTNLIYVADSKTNIDDIFSKYEIDFVFICTPTNTHYELVKKCIGYKKNIFCEKPFTGDINKALELYELANENIVKIWVDNIFLLTDVFNEIKTKNIKNISFIWNKYDLNYKENLYDSLLYHDIYMLIKLTDNKWEVSKSNINDSILDIELINDFNLAIFSYNRNMIDTKEKIIIIDSIEFDFKNNTNDSLYKTIENIVSNNIDYSDNKKTTLDTLKLISKIKNN